MKKGQLAQILGFDAEDRGSATGPSESLRVPTIDERVDLFLGAVHGDRDFTSEERANARARMLDEIAADMATKAGISLPEDLQNQSHEEAKSPIWAAKQFWVGRAGIGLIAAALIVIVGPLVWQNLQERSYFRKPGTTQVAEVNTGEEQRTLTRSVRRRSKLVVSPTEPQLQGKPSRLGVSLREDAGPGSILVLGLPSGSVLSIGEPVGDDGWHVATDDVDSVLLTPPPGFTGVMDLFVEFHRMNDTTADRKRLRLEWIKRKSQ